MFPTDRWLLTLPPASSSLTLKSQTRDRSQMRCNWKTGQTGSPTTPSMTPTRKKRKKKNLRNASVSGKRLHLCCRTSPAVWRVTIVVVTIGAARNILEGFQQLAAEAEKNEKLASLFCLFVPCCVGPCWLWAWKTGWHGTNGLLIINEEAKRFAAPQPSSLSGSREPRCRYRGFTIFNSPRGSTLGHNGRRQMTFERLKICKICLD